MKQFSHYLDKTGEVGFVIKSFPSLVQVSGLPEARPSEIVLFETGEVGQVISLKPDLVEVLLLSISSVRAGTRAARTGELLKIGVSPDVLGKSLTPLGHSYSGSAPIKKISEYRPVDIIPLTIVNRKNIDKLFETGVSWVDLVIPLGKGQRELVIGDRKIGKTSFLMQVMLATARKGMVCVYAAIAKRQLDIKLVEEFVKANAIANYTTIIASSASDPAGLVFLTPYTAMTIAEYFRDNGKDVLLILDDMTAHAKYYRELSLLARRFPGRSSYPGDIFYVQSRLLERAGNFIRTQKNPDGTLERIETSITCLPVAELVMGDISGYIQTNLMSITDGHIFFDSDLYNQGRRPAINPFLSVTRVGHQTQPPLFRDISRELTSFLVHFEKLRAYMHFGAELSEATKRNLVMGEQIMVFLEQSSDSTVPLSLNAVLLAALWAGFWKGKESQVLKSSLNQIVTHYHADSDYAQEINQLLETPQLFAELIKIVKQNQTLLELK